MSTHHTALALLALPSLLLRGARGTRRREGSAERGAVGAAAAEVPEGRTPLCAGPFLSARCRRRGVCRRAPR